MQFIQVTLRHTLYSFPTCPYMENTIIRLVVIVALRLFPACWSITSHWWGDEQLNILYLLCFFCFQYVWIVANYSKNFQIMYSDLLDKLQNTLSLNYCVELFKELFPTCWSTTSHWWSDEQLHKLYLLCFLFVSDMLELLQTILKTFTLCWALERSF